MGCPSAGCTVAVGRTAAIGRTAVRPYGTSVGLCCIAVLLAVMSGWKADAQEGNATAVFTDRAAELGLDVDHVNGMSGKFYFSEIFGPGGALFDYDNDGDVDVYLVQGHPLGRGKSSGGGDAPRDRLFRNDLVVAADGSRTVRFTEVTEESGIRAYGYGMGVATGDYDNDGWTDLYLTNFGANQLWRNDGASAEGVVTFTDVTAEAGVDDSRWSVPATFVDIDRDGWLDLFVGNYVEFTIEAHKLCRTLAGAPDYCSPLAFRPEPDRLLRNRGRSKDGRVTFEDWSARAGIAGDYGGALGAVTADFNADGWPDLYVGNDGMPNQMWINRKGTTFRNEALLAGTGVNYMGQPEASMGVTVGDVDADGDEDLFLTHLVRETNTLYLNDGSGLFEDATGEAGLDTASWSFTGFGTAWLDYDNDGWLDLLTANGEVRVIPELEARGDPHPLHQTNQLFRNLGKASRDSDSGGSVRFEDVTLRAGEVFRLSEVSRGVAVGDVDNDGDSDVLLLNNNGPARLLINAVGQRNHWLGLRLVGGQPARDQLGAWVEIVRPGRPSLGRRVATGGSFLSASDPRVLVGLGDSPEIERVVVRWPGGRREQWQVPADRYTTLVEGSGTAVTGVAR